ncbi:MAG: glycerol-3-phosphate 1-O-acyltransferase PlsY [Glaciecola sp.]|jgi:glycerol-3-phosphate acyltransferase PlsY|nr:glycerol-3-phosphate 1-O-acyltransferase PlsY [Glaciecola sp.]
MEITIMLTILAAYVLGSCTSAVFIAKVFQLPDPRSTGSANPGATNVFRIGGKIPAIIVLVLDLLKGSIAVYSAHELGLSDAWLGIVAIAVCLGHMYPIFYHFSGGKGVATAFGCLMPLGFNIIVTLTMVWIITYRLFRYSSLAALVTVGIAPLATYFFNPKYTLAVSMLALLIIWRHQHNITRLLQGSEPKV